MGNTSVRSHNSVPVADSSEARDATPLWISFLRTIFSFPRLSFYSSLEEAFGIFPTSRNVATILNQFDENVGKSSHEYVSTLREKILLNFA